MAFDRRRLLQVSAATALSAPFISRRGFAADEPIKVGSLLDQSGPIGTSGTPMYYAAQVAVSEINAAGGLLGRQLELVHYDTQSTIQLYSQYAQELALKDKVSVVQGGITSASREAIRPVFDRNKILYFYNVLYEGGVCDRDIFCTGTTPAQTVNKLVAYAQKTWGKNAYIVAADYNYGQITAKWMTKYTQDGGGKVFATEFFPLDVSNFSATISKIQEAKPDIVLSALVGSNHTGFYRQWAASGMKDKIPIASTTFGLVNELATMEAKESDGIVTGYGYFEELDTPANKAFVKKVKDRFGQNIPYMGELTAINYEGYYHLGSGGKKGRHARSPEGHRSARNRHRDRWSNGSRQDRPADPSHHPQRLSRQGREQVLARLRKLSRPAAVRYRRCLRPDQEPERQQTVRYRHQDLRRALDLTTWI